MMIYIKTNLFRNFWKFSMAARAQNIDFRYFFQGKSHRNSTVHYFYMCNISAFRERCGLANKIGLVDFTRPFMYFKSTSMLKKGLK